MNERQRVERVVREWAAIGAIPNTQMGLCELWLLGPNARNAPCSQGLEDLIGRLDREFSTRFDLSPADFDGAVGSVDELVAFVLVQPVAQAFGRAMFAAAKADPAAAGRGGARSLERVMSDRRNAQSREARPSPRRAPKPPKKGPSSAKRSARGTRSKRKPRSGK
jgi:hypothetical protein